MERSGVAVVGSLNFDMRLAVGRLPESGETITSDSVHRCAGGKGANQAAAAARLGRPVTMIGAVGDDDAGRHVLSRLASEGVTTSGIDVVDDTTGLAVILWEQPESTIVIGAGANARVTGDLVRSHREQVRDAAVVLCQLETPASALDAVTELAGGLTILNPAPSTSLPPDLVRRFDVVVPNRFELAALAGADEAPTSVAEVRAMTARLAHPGVVVTLGAEGCVVQTVDRDGEHAAVHIPPHDVDAVDTTGAGDSFCAGLADALLDGSGLVDAARWATAVAASTTTRHGALDSLPHRAELVPTAQPSAL